MHYVGEVYITFGIFNENDNLFKYIQRKYTPFFNFFSIVFINSEILNEANASGGRFTNKLTIALIFQISNVLTNI